MQHLPSRKTFSRLDILIHNAGVGGGLFPIGASDVKDWWNTINISLRDPYFLAHAFRLLLPTGGDKQIVYVSSLKSSLKMPRLSAYAISKLALLRFAEFVNAVQGKHRMLLYCIRPGDIRGTETKDDVGVPEFGMVCPSITDIVAWECMMSAGFVHSLRT